MNEVMDERIKKLQKTVITSTFVNFIMLFSILLLLVLGFVLLVVSMSKWARVTTILIFMGFGIIKVLYWNKKLDDILEN